MDPHDCNGYLHEVRKLLIKLEASLKSVKQQEDGIKTTISNKVEQVSQQHI